MHLWSHGSMGDWKITEPTVLGHEASGVIVQIGSNVSNVKVGDEVTLEPNDFCGFCEACIVGDNQLCQATDNPIRDLYLQEYTTVNARKCTKLPVGVSLEAAAVTEPLACVIHAIKRSGLTCGQRVLVCGAGPMGLLSALAAKAFGASKIVITDINEKRLEHAKSIGIESGYLISKDNPPAQQCKDIIEMFGGKAPDVTLECTGFQAPIRLAIDVTKCCGIITLVGLGAEYVDVPLTLASMKEINLIGTAKYDSASFQRGLALMASGAIKAESIVSHRVPLTDFQKAFDLIVKGEASKVLIQP